MATLYTQQDKNVRKTWMLMATFLILIVAIGFIFSQIYGNPSILYGFFVFAIFMNIFAYWNSAKIALRVSGAKPADENEYRELHNIIENLSITAGLPKPKVYIIEDQAPNAFATGRNAKHSAVAFTTGILAILDKSELEGVAAHELSHIGNKDILISTIAVVLAGFISLFADMFLRSQMVRVGGNDDNRAGAMMMVAGLVLAILAPIFAMLIQLAISRKREFLADASGALLTRYPEGLASALQKISSYGRPMQKAHDATAHLFIANPFGGKAVRGVHKLFMTHPPVEDRISALIGNNEK